MQLAGESACMLSTLMPAWMAIRVSLHTSKLMRTHTSTHGSHTGRWGHQVGITDGAIGCAVSRADGENVGKAVVEVDSSVASTLAVLYTNMHRRMYDHVYGHSCRHMH